MSSKRIKQIQKDILNAEKKHNWSKVLEYHIDLGQEYLDDQDFENAEAAYIKAAGLFQKISNPTEDDRDNEFLRLRKLVEVYADEEGEYRDPEKVEENFAKLIAFAEKPWLARRVQIAYHVGAYCFHQVSQNNNKWLRKALTYARKSLDILNKDSKAIDLQLKAVKAHDDSIRRRSGIYIVLAAIYFDLEDLENAVKYNQEALEWERRHPDPDLRYRILFSKHGFETARSKRLEISEHLYSLIEHHHKAPDKATRELWASRRLELLPILARDLLINAKEDLNQHDKWDRADRLLWSLYKLDENDPNGKQGLIMLEILRRNQSKIDLLCRDENPDWRTIAGLFEECGDRTADFSLPEMAQDYYEQMRQSAMKLPGDLEFGDLEIARSATQSLAETYMELRDYRSAALFFDNLIQIETRLALDESIIFHTKLSAVIAKSKCIEYTFRQKLTMFEDLLKDTSDRLRKLTLEKLIEFLKKDPEGEEHLSAYKADLKALRHVDDADTDDSDPEEAEEADNSDKCDAIFDQLLEKHRHDELVEEFIAKRDKLNNHGETELITAAKTKALSFVKMLVDECYYDIDTPDSGGWTALSEAVAHRRIDIVRFLIDRKANPNTQSTETLLDEKTGNHATAEGATPLMEACMNGDLGIIDILLEGGADVLLKNNSGRTAADYIDEYLRKNADDDDKSLNRELRKRSASMRQKEREAGVAEGAKKPDLPEKIIPTAPVVRKRLDHDAPAVLQYQKVIGDLGARTKTSAIRATERDVTSLDLMDDGFDFDAPEAMEVDLRPSSSRRHFTFVTDENDIIVDDILPGTKRPSSSGGHSSSVKRKKTLDDHFNQSCLMNTPTSTQSRRRRNSGTSTISGTSNPTRSSTGRSSTGRGSTGLSSSRHTTPTHLPSNNSYLLNVTFVDPVSKFPIAKLNPMKCGTQTTISELCIGVQSLVMDDNYDEILPHRGDLPLNVDDTVGDALRGVIVRSFELNLHLKGWTPTAKTLFQRLGVAISDDFSKTLDDYRSKHWSFNGIVCSRAHLPRFLQGLALLLSRASITSVTIGPDPLVKKDNTAVEEPSNLNANVAKWLGILMRGKTEVSIIGTPLEDAWLEHISIQHDMAANVDTLSLKQGHYASRSVANFLENCGSPVTLDLSLTELADGIDASWDTVIDKICGMPRLKTLRLAGTTVTTFQVQRILNVCPNLLNLDISNTSVDLSALNSCHIQQLKAANMKSKPCDLSSMSENFPKLIHFDISLGTATIADALRHFGHQSMLVVALFCQIGEFPDSDFTTLQAVLLVSPSVKSKLVHTGFPDSKFSKLSVGDVF